MQTDKIFKQFYDLPVFYSLGKCRMLFANFCKSHCQSQVIKFSYIQNKNVGSTLTYFEAGLSRTSYSEHICLKLHRKSCLINQEYNIGIELGRQNIVKLEHMLSNDSAVATCMFVVWLEIISMQFKYAI